MVSKSLFMRMQHGEKSRRHPKFPEDDKVFAERATSENKAARFGTLQQFQFWSESLARNSVSGHLGTLVFGQ
jgi:hypothetical protein